MPFSFPSSPTVGQQSTQNGRVYQWTGSVWELVAIAQSIQSTNLSDSTAAGRAILTAADAAAQRASLGLTRATQAEVTGTRTTGSITSGQASLTVASAADINIGDTVSGEGIAPGTTVSAISGTTITLSANANATLSSDPVSFFRSDRVLTPGSAAGGLCRAWVNFQGSGTVYIRAARNVSSITDNGVGNYAINFNVALPDSNYCVVCGSDDSTATATRTVSFSSTLFTASNLSILAKSGGTLTDLGVICVAVFR